MAHPDNLPKDVIESVAAKIGADVGGILGPAAAKQLVELTESFSVWSLGLDSVSKSGVDIARLAHETGMWHHQIKVDGKAVAFARSMPLGAEAASWSVQGIFESEISQKIDDGIEWVDQSVKGDPVVRLLVVPAYHIHAFWITDGKSSQVLLVDVPDGFTKLVLRKLYTSKEFFEAIIQEQHIIGISK